MFSQQSEKSERPRQSLALTVPSTAEHRFLKSLTWGHCPLPPAWAIYVATQGY